MFDTIFNLALLEHRTRDLSTRRFDNMTTSLFKRFISVFKFMVLYK